MKILIFGGTRFIGRPLVSKLLSKNHEVILFTRGIQPIPKNVLHIKGDRKNVEHLKQLQNKKFDVIIDSSGRTLEDTKLVLDSVGLPEHRFLYISSAGVYANSEKLPIDESYDLDPNSRHSGKVDTENWLIKQGIPFTSFRPTYIYGPGNYNPIEKWFFDRILNNRPIPLPRDGHNITQLGHVSDLAQALTDSLEKEISNKRIYNCSGKKAITFLGLLNSATRAVGKSMDEVKVKFFDPTGLDTKARKCFPIRMTNFYTDVSLIESELGWKETFDIDKGLQDSYKNDYLVFPRLAPDFTNDSNLLEI